MNELNNIPFWKNKDKKKFMSFIEYLTQVPKNPLRNLKSRIYSAYNKNTVNTSMFII